ncbi:MAG: mechanosensitive ion channel family protein [Acidimicrobiia bacterium]|nr:mechanosensitive ion channel family protein [Acidimicrobiia bacterium]
MQTVDLLSYQELVALTKDKVDEALKIVLILVGSGLLIRAVRVLADRLVKLVQDDDPLTTSQREQRAITLAGIFKGVFRIAIVIVSGLTILDILGINTTPLIAGAGVAGLAISFGAQNLIRDFISGFFILMENQYKVGGVIRAAGVSGQVEDMNLRITVLRDLEGVAHFVPNGEIKVVSNLAKEWSRAVVNVGVAYQEDLDRVVSVLNEVGLGLQRDPVFGPSLLEAPQVLGVESFGDSQITVRVMAKTRPLKQWEAARELRKRIKAAFDREGIEIPFPQCVIYSRTGTEEKLPGSDKSQPPAIRFEAAVAS